MCGVCGVVRPTGILLEDQTAVNGLNGLQRHRGPDGAGRWADERAALGHTRLAVVDLTEGGHQPFSNADGSVVVVFNGEIYNHEELRRRYRLAAVDLCDGAILPQLWEHLGVRMFAQLRGMYAIAVYDVRAGTTTLARDPFGIKPLYWTRAGQGPLAFASEPRALLSLASCPELDGVALRHYLMFGAMARDQSPFSHISAVPANGWVTWDRELTRSSGEITSNLFDALPARDERQLREDFLTTVSLHLNSDVPVALLLSSGLDSAAIAWACAVLDAPLTCVTVETWPAPGDRGDRDRESPRESVGAARVAATFGHRHEIVGSPPTRPLVARFFAAMQRPSIDGLNTFLVSRSIASLGIKVALSGLGGDELLAGYPSFRMLRYLPLLRAGDAIMFNRLIAGVCGATNEKLAYLLGAGGPRDAVGLAHLSRRVFLDRQVDALAPGTPWGVRLGADGDSSARSLSLAELAGYLGGTLLPDTDAFSMAWSVEIRVPYVDVAFARAALSFAPRRGVGKRRFAAILDDRELRGIARRPKLGFTLPMDRWMRKGPLAEVVRAAEAPDARVRGILDPDAVSRVLCLWRDGRLGWSRAWSIVSLDAWLRSLDREVAPPSRA